MQKQQSNHTKKNRQWQRRQKFNWYPKYISTTLMWFLVLGAKKVFDFVVLAKPHFAPCSYAYNLFATFFVVNYIIIHIQELVIRWFSCQHITFDWQQQKYNRSHWACFVTLSYQILSIRSTISQSIRHFSFFFISFHLIWLMIHISRQ